MNILLCLGAIFAAFGLTCINPVSAQGGINAAPTATISHGTDSIRNDIEEPYEVQYTLTFEDKTFIPYHTIRVQGGIHRKGAFLSTIGNSVNLDVTILGPDDQTWEYLPNNIGYIFPRLMWVELPSLGIRSIQRSNFKNFEILNELRFNSNQIDRIPFDCFFDLKWVGHIQIRANHLKNIHVETFTRNPALRTVDLSGNKIESLKPKNFNNKNIVVLNLNNNQLESIPFDAFDGMDNVEDIFIASNKLNAIHSDTFSNNLKLTSIYLSENLIQSLPAGLLRNNKDLTTVDFSDNRISAININTTFEKYGDYNFIGNTCIDSYYRPNQVKELNAMNAELKSRC